MKNHHLKGITFLIIFAGIFILSGNLSTTKNNPGIVDPQLAEGAEEGGPINRLAFEFLRLKSPVTNTIPEGIQQRSLSYAKTLPGSNEMPLRLERSNSHSSSLNWTNRGPYNVGGRTRGVTFDRNDVNTIIAGGVSGGIWRTTDGGQSWAKMTKSDQLHSVSSIVQDPRDGMSNIWYATTGELSGNSAGARGAPFRGDGVYKSTDNGLNWNLIPPTSTSTPQLFDNYLNYSWRIKVHPTTGHIFTASFGSIYRSKNDGRTWEVVLGQGSDRYSDLAMTSTGLMIAVLGNEETDGPILRSTDGETWTSIAPVNFPATFNRMVPDISESNDSIAYFIGNDSDNHFLWKYHYQSGDGSNAGGEWTDLSANIPNDFNSQGGYDLYVRISPYNEKLVYLGGTNLYYSPNGWESTAGRLKIGGYGWDAHHPDQHDVIFFPNDSLKVLSASDGGLHTMEAPTQSGRQWNSLNNGYTTTQFYTIAIDPSGTYPDLIMGGTQDNGTLESLVSSGTSPWEQVFGGDGAYCSVINMGKAYVVSSQRGYTLMLDWSNPFGWSYGNGQGKYNNYSWAYLIPPDFDREEEALFISPVYSDPVNDHILYYAGGKHIYRNNDVYLNEENYEQPSGGGGYESKNWEKLQRTAAIGSISAFGGSINNPPHRLYYGSSSGYVYRLDNAHKSDQAVNIKNNISTSGYVSGISVDPYNGDKVMVSYSNYEVRSIYYSENGGDSWTDVSGNLEENVSGRGNGPSVRDVYIYPLKTGYKYFAATSTGLYSTDQLDGTSTVWEQEGASTIGNVVVDMIDGRPADGYVAIATHGNGMYSANFGGDVLSVDDPDLPTSFELAENYPNPFNPSTQIPFTLNKGGVVTLKVFDIAGREVATLFHGEKSAGAHHVTWNGKDGFGNQMPTGMYIYRIESNGLVQSKKMQLLK